MICPDCGHDNIEGVDTCEACGSSLVVGISTSELEDTITRHPVKVLDRKTPITISGSESVQKAIKQMVDEKIGCLLVEDEGALAGIFTERDILNKVSGDLSALAQPVSSFMTASPATITINDSIAYALHSMDVGGYRHVPIIDNEGNPSGIISVRDILRFLSVRFAEIRTPSA